MAWTRRPLPNDETTYQVWYAAGQWIIQGSSSSFATADFATYRTFPDVLRLPGGSYMSVQDLVSDGVRWYACDRNYGWARSTDGLAGAQWEFPSPQIISPSFGTAGAASLCVTSTGRIVARAGNYICVSDDDGATWAETGLATSAVSVSGAYDRRNDERITQSGDGTIVLTGRVGEFFVSDDDGDTWSAIYPGVQYAIATVAKITAGYCVTYQKWDIPPRISTDNGSTWTDVALLGLLRAVAEGETLYLYGGEYGAPEVRVTTDLVTWSAIDPAGLAAEMFEDIAVGGGVLMGVTRWDSYGAYTAEVGPAVIAPIALPLRLVVAGVTPIALPLRLAVSNAGAIGLPLRLSVGTTGAPVALPLRLAVVDASAVGGLNGAGAWAAAPDGKWTAIVTLDGANISARLQGACSVEIADNAARTAEFSFVPAAPLAVMGLFGRRVTIAFARADGTAVQPIFAGVVDVPTVDLQTGIITCECTDQAQEVWSNTARERIAELVGGRWHDALAGELEDNFAYLEERIQGVPTSWALDVRQQPAVLPWQSPARTLTVRTADVIDGSLSVDLPSRDQLRTRIVCRLQYRFARLRARTVQASYSQPLSFFQPLVSNALGVLKQSKLLMTVAMVESATESVGGWTMEWREITSPRPGGWNLGSSLSPVIYYITPSTAQTLALGFSVRYSTRWQQSVTEDYTVAVVWSGLEAQLPAPVSEEMGASLEAEFDQPGWGQDPSVGPALPSTLLGDVVYDYKPAGFDDASRDELMRALLDRAWVRLWSASRSGRVNFALPCRPDISLSDAIALEHDAMRASGRVVAVTHTLNLESGTAVTDVSVAVGMPGATPAAQPVWTLPAAPQDDYSPPISAYSCQIGTYVGGDPASPPWNEETMVGFSTNYEGPEDPSINYYPHQLRIKGPDLAAEDRDPRTLTVSAELPVAVPTDVLEIL